MGGLEKVNEMPLPENKITQNILLIQISGMR